MIEKHDILCKLQTAFSALLGYLLIFVLNAPPLIMGVYMPIWWALGCAALYAGLCNTLGKMAFKYIQKSIREEGPS